MPKKRWIENEKIDPAHLDTSIWPIVHEDKLDSNDKETFFARKKAIDMYMKNERPLHEISAVTLIDRKDILAFVKRCLSYDDQGRIWGYRALIPRKRLKQYERKSLPILSTQDELSKMTGAFTLLLKQYPTVKETIDNLYLGRNTKREVRSPKISVKDLHGKLLDACTKAGITSSEYPFISGDLGKRSLYRYVDILEQWHFGEAAKRYGENASQKARHTGIGAPNAPSPVRPLERVQFDGHRIDCSIAIVFHTPEGDEIVEVMDRLWLLCIIDVATRIILGHHLSFNKEYSASDVLHCIKKAVMPKEVLQLTIPGLTYHPNGGYASRLFPEMEWALWDEFHLDNGKSNLANQVRDRLKRTIGCSVNAGPVALPMRRGIIERFFETLEENGFHRLVNTTGSNPKDPRRQDPEKKAVKYRITAEHIEELTDVLISNYNGTKHEGINLLTPLQCLEQRLNRGLLPRVMTEEKRQEIAFLSLAANRVVQGNISQGKRPFIYYEGTEYRNEVLSRSPELIGTPLDLLVNIDDLRVIRAFLPDGSEFGTLTANGKWGITPHSLQVRKQINKLKKLKILHFTNYDDPIECYHRYLQEQAKTSRSDRNRLAALQRSKKKEKEKLVSKEVLPDDTQSENVVPLIEASTKKSMNIDRKRFRTITY
ncbi:Integrase core domain-containing protein [Paenibacillus algorifonticola]|uniref:Integrase core domain-containing protein n=1 Tax=Paenibacillus algorifonticola TaxID=684063 RepID=A0A1I1YY63_9BACL|nr:DDE-type integrase/transposase/recombinase [Paenibacillus algorifonticola]SFE24409.1 Integrase core domain-containing protein [Paenibacillus algorifonticola]